MNIRIALFVTVLLGMPLLNGMENPNNDNSKILLEHNEEDFVIDRSDPVMVAVYNRDFESLKKLVENGKADLAKVTENKVTPLAYIAEKYPAAESTLNFVNYLIDHGADVNQRSGIKNKLPIEHAINVGDSELARCLIQRGSYINENILSIADEASCTLLHYAIEEGMDSEFIKLLLQRGAGVTKLYPEGDSMLHKELSESPRSEVCRLLLEYGANPNQSDEKGRTALHVLSCQHEEDTFENINNLHEIDLGSMKTIVDLLLDKGALIEAKNNKEETPLMYAVRKGRLDIVLALISNGAQRTWNCNRGNMIKGIIDENLQRAHQNNASFEYALWKSIRIIIRSVDLQKAMQWHREHHNGLVLAEVFKDSTIKNHVERFKMREIEGKHLKKTYANKRFASRRK